MAQSPEARAGLLARFRRKVREDGWRAAAAAAQGRYARWQAATPVWWARFGRASLSLARAWRPRPPAVLVLSLGRSGSTWVAEMLSEAADAVYLDEPVNRSVVGRVDYHSQIDEVPAHPPPLYQRYADLAFAACPAFAYPMLRTPGRWGLAQRRRRRLVIKEVNPLGAPWLLPRFRPRVILLVRHPAAIALSSRKLSWWPDDPQPWRVHAFRQARALSAAWNSLAGYGDYCVVLYEDVCLAPLERFRALYDFAGLQWGEKVEQLVRARSASRDRQNPWATSRDSRSMVDAWRDEISADALQQVKAGWGAFDLPWYRADTDW